jgi:cytochrome d ubiquinol oxidase subunit I
MNVLTPEPLHISLLMGRVAIASAALTHSLFATFIVGTTVIAALTATAAYVSGNPRYARLAHVMAFTLVLSTGTISFLGVNLVFCLNIFWPRFWHTIFRVMFWPFLTEALLFLGEAVFAYAWYYLWDWTSGSPWKRRWHLSCIWLAAGCAVAAMFMIDIVASYMLTPSPLAAGWSNILNPTMVDLDLHRWFGNLTWAGFALAAICAIGYLRTDDAEERQSYAWGAGYCFLIGFGALLLMPIIGYQYLLHLRYGQPQAFQTLMLGERSWMFDLVGIFYGLLVLAGSLYIAVMLDGRIGSGATRFFVRGALGVLLAAAILLGLPYHLRHIPAIGGTFESAILPWGKMQPYKYIALALLVVLGVGNWLVGVGGFSWRAREAARLPSPAIILTLAGLTMLLMLNMGWVRETARAANGYLIFEHFALADEGATYRQTPAVSAKGVGSQPGNRRGQEDGQ